LTTQQPGAATPGRQIAHCTVLFSLLAIMFAAVSFTWIVLPEHPIVGSPATMFQQGATPPFSWQFGIATWVVWLLLSVRFSVTEQAGFPCASL